MYLDMVVSNPGFNLPDDWKRKIQLDTEVVRAIKSSDVALYVGSLLVVPDESHAEEISLVRRIQPNIVGILNYAQMAKRNANESDRVKLWTKFFHENDVDQFVVFDAHWDKYSKVGTIYEKISAVISERDNEIFSHGLEQFKKRQLSISREACDLIANCIMTIRSISHEFKKTGYSEENAKHEIRASLQKVFLDFVDKTTGLYLIASKYPTDSIESIRIKLDAKPNWKNRISSGVGTATIIGTFGAIIGALSSGLVTAGVAAVPGAVLGAQIGGIIGSAIGALYTFFNRSEDAVIITLESDEIRGMLQQLIAVTWGLSMKGYGRDQELTLGEIHDIEEDVRILFYESELSSDDWKEADAKLISRVALSILNKLEGYW